MKPDRSKFYVIVHSETYAYEGFTKNSKNRIFCLDFSNHQLFFCLFLYESRVRQRRFPAAQPLLCFVLSSLEAFTFSCNCPKHRSVAGFRRRIKCLYLILQLMCDFECGFLILTFYSNLLFK